MPWVEEWKSPIFLEGRYSVDISLTCSTLLSPAILPCLINGLKHGWQRQSSCLVITTVVYGAWNVWGGKLKKQNQK